jgi:uncharacterized protein (TIGR02145 family)
MKKLIFSLFVVAAPFWGQAQNSNPTSFCLPSVVTTAPSQVGLDSALVGGNVLSDGGQGVLFRGLCYGTTPNPNMGNARTENGSGLGSFVVVLRGLIPSTTYFVRAYAKGTNGVVVYGNDVTFLTGSLTPAFSCGTSTVSDTDGNVYNTVQIGQQCWTRSNLRVGRYRNGNSIPNTSSNTTWSQANSSSTGSWCNYNNSTTNGTTYGRLYNGYAVNDSRGLCPTGWHVPSDAEWTNLVTFLGGDSWAGGALKSTGMLPTVGGWTAPNTNASNSSGFTALPGGYRATNGSFFSLSDYGGWWSSSTAGAGLAWARLIWYGNAAVDRVSYDQRFGFSVRCVKD